MIINDDNAFYAYLSLYSDKPHWQIGFPNEVEVHKLPVGAIVFIFLNRIKRIKEDGRMDFSMYEPHIAEEMKTEIFDQEVWYTCYDEMIQIIENRFEMNADERYRAYKTYCQLAFFLVVNLDWDEWISFAESCKKTYEINCPYYIYTDVIVSRGNRVDIKGLPYECYEVAGFEYLFILDLWELLFNPNVESRVKQCPNCHEFFYTTTNQQKYCLDCKEKKKYNRIKNDKQKEDEAKVLSKRISDILYRREKAMMTRDGNEYPSQEYQDFLDENQYYKDVLKGRQVESNPDYQDIKTEAEYLSWLKKYHAMIKRKRGRKHGETDETSKRNGSDHESQGET